MKIDAFHSRRRAFWLVLLAAGCASAPALEDTAQVIPYGKAKRINVPAQGWPAGTRVSLSPGGPYVGGRLALPGGAAAVAVDQRRGLVARRKGGLLAFELAGPRGAPTPLGDYRPGTRYTRIAMRAGQALVADEAGGLSLLGLGASGLRVLGRTRAPRPVSALALSDQRAYALYGGDSIAVLDLSVPSTLRFVARIRLRHSARTLAAAGDRLYAALGSAGVAVFDITDPGAPVRLTTLRAGGPALDVSANGDRLYVAAGSHGVTAFEKADSGKLRWRGSHGRLGTVNRIQAAGHRILAVNTRNVLYTLDAADPARLTIAAAFLGPEELGAVAYSGELAFAADSRELLTIDPRAPTPAVSNENLDVGQGVNFGGQRRVVIQDGLAYVADWFSGLHIYDVSLPRLPRHLSSWHTPGSPKGIAVRRGVAFIADDDHGLQVIDVRDPRNPHRIAHLQTAGLAYTPVLAGERLYLAGHRGGFQIIDVSDPADPQLLGQYDTPGKAWSLAVKGETVFVADSESGLLAFDVTDPYAPRPVGRFAPGGHAEDVRIRDDLAFAAFFDAGVYVVDIRDPTAPRPVGHVQTPGNARGLDLAGDFAYVADWFAGLQVIDIRNPAAPRLMGGYDTLGAAWGVRVAGDRAYVMDWWGGFGVLDVSTPARPRPLGNYHRRGTVNDVAADGGFAYVADGAGRLQVFDIRNALNPIWATAVELGGNPQTVALHNGYAYVARGADGVAVVDVRNPFQARWVGRVETPGAAGVIRVHERTAYVTDSAVGVIALDLSDPRQPHPLAGYGRSVNDLWPAGRHLYAATDRGIEVLRSGPDDHLDVVARHLAGKQVTLVRARGKTLFAYAPERGIVTLDLEGRAPDGLMPLPAGDSVMDMQLGESRLYASTARSGLLAFSIGDPGQTLLATRHPLVSRLGRLVLHEGVAYLGGEEAITAVRLLPAVAGRPGPDGILRVAIPKGLPLGHYNLTLTSPKGHRTVRPNALEVRLSRRAKPTLSREQLQTIMEQRRQANRPAP